MNENIRQILRNLVVEWRDRSLPTIKNREIEIEDWTDNESVFKIVTVVGFRRVGKTYLLLDYAAKKGKDKCLYLNLEDERLPKKTEVLTELVNVVKEFYGNQMITLLLDEIQEIPDWSRWARRVNESRTAHLVLSGSSSKLSSREIPTELRGRMITKTIFPLSFREYRAWTGREGILAMGDYLKFGGFPEIVLAEEGRKPLLLDDYFQTFLVRDIIERYRPRQEAAIRDLIRLLLNSQYYTFGKLAKSLKMAGYSIGVGTVANYVSWLTNSYFLRPLEIHSPRVKQRIANPKKAYFADSYFVSKLSGNFSQNIGKLMEEAVASYLFRKESHSIQDEVFYWKDQRDKEVDFVIMDGVTVKELIQVSYVSSLLEIPEREIASLKKAERKLNCSNLTLITWDFEGVVEGVNCVPLAKFLQSHNT